MIQSPDPQSCSDLSDQHLATHIRWMIRRDMPEVLAIEAESFEFPWPMDTFIRYLQTRSCIGIVAEHDEQVVGFAIYDLCKTKIDLLNLAVAGRFRRQGVGRQIITKLVNKLSIQRRTRITANVRETNLPAQLFFRAMGFRAVAVIERLYDDTDEDAYRMSYRIKGRQASDVK